MEWLERGTTASAHPFVFNDVGQNFHKDKGITVNGLRVLFFIASTLIMRCNPTIPFITNKQVANF